MTQIDPLTLKGILNGDIDPADRAVELVDTVMELLQEKRDVLEKIDELDGRISRLLTNNILLRARVAELETRPE